MFRAAVLVLAAGCALWSASSLAPVLQVPEVLGIGIVAAWLLWGPVAGVAIATIAWSLLGLAWAFEDRLDPMLAGQDILVSGTICSFPRVNGRAERFVLRVAGGPTDPHLPARIYLGSYGVLQAPLSGGEQWRLLVRLKRPRGLSNPGSFDFERWALAQRLGGTGYVRQSAANRRIRDASYACPTMRPRQALANAIERSAGVTGAGRFLPALAVGARHRLTRGDWTLLRRTGTAHLIAISGLHIGLVAGLLLALGRGAGHALLTLGVRCAPRSIGRISAVFGAAAYAALAGFSVPTTRAFVMVVVATLLLSRRRVVCGWQILGTAVIAVVCVEPLAMFSAGFWLSFGAAAVLMLAGLGVSAHPPAAGSFGRGIASRLRPLLRAQCALSAGLAPLAMMFFAEVSLIGPFANLVMVPLFAMLVVPLTLAGTVLVSVAPVAAAAALGVAAAVLGASLDVLADIATWSGSTWRRGVAGQIWAIAACSSGLLLAWPRPLRFRWTGAMVLVALALGADRQAVPALRVIVMDVGQGLAVLVQTPDHALLYDAGPSYGDRDAGQSVVVPWLSHLRVTHLDAIVISHGDNDHVGGVRSVMAAYPAARVIAAEPLAESGRDVDRCVAGMQWRWNGIRFRILHPGAGGAATADNDRSCVLSVSAESASALLPGDVERGVEARLQRDGRLGRHDVVVAPHHGSRTSSSVPFVTATAPRYVVFSTGFANRWGFPHLEVRDRWDAVGACLLDTARSGALIFEANATGPLRLVRLNRWAARRLWTEGVLSGDGCAPSGSTNSRGARL